MANRQPVDGELPGTGRKTKKSLSPVEDQGFVTYMS